MTIDSWLAAAEGDASGFWFQSLLADLAFPKSFVWGELRRRRGDSGRRARRRTSTTAPEATRARSSATTRPRVRLGRRRDSPTRGRPTPDERRLQPRCRRRTSRRCSSAGSSTSRRRRRSATKELLPHLPNGHQVVLPGFGHSNDFWTDQPEAGTHLLDTFLATGKVDDSRYEPQKVDFTPEVTQTALGKGLAGDDGRPRRPDRALAAADGPPRPQARALRPQGERDAALASTRSCSAWAAGSSAS